MGEWGWIVLVFVVGAGLEIGGLYVVYREVQSEVDGIRSFLSRGRTHYASASLDAHSKGSAHATGRDAPLPEQIRLLRERVGALEDGLSSMRAELRSHTAGPHEHVTAGHRAALRATEALSEDRKPPKRCHRGRAPWPGTCAGWTTTSSAGAGSRSTWTRVRPARRPRRFQRCRL